MANPPHEDIAGAISKAAEHLTSLSKDDLMKVVESLKASNVDVERLVRLSKLSAKAAEGRVLGGGSAAYHY